MKDLAEGSKMDKMESHRFKNWKHKGRDAEVRNLTLFLDIDSQQIIM